MRYKGFELSGERHTLSVLGSDKYITSTGESFLQIQLQGKTLPSMVGFALPEQETQEFA